MKVVLMDGSITCHCIIMNSTILFHCCLVLFDERDPVLVHDALTQSTQFYSTTILKLNLLTV